MKLLGEIFNFLTVRGEKPEIFGGFHIAALIITVAATLFICKRYRNGGEAFVRRLLFITSLVVLLFEVYKQLAYSLTFDGERFIFEYKWHIFPFQFCSTPMFVGLAAAVIKNKKTHYALCAYLATYSLFAGGMTLIFAAQLFSNMIGINIQTVICHGSMVMIGVYLLSTGYVRAELKTVLYALPVFLFGVITALVLNELSFLKGIPEGQVFNMYYLSPYFPEDAPLFIPFRKIFKGTLFPIAYIVVFTLLACMTVLLGKKRNK